MVYLLATEKDDCDYHIQTSPKPRTKTKCLVRAGPGRHQEQVARDQEPLNSGSVMRRLSVFGYRVNSSTMPPT
jgi:hypothetical protein